MITKKEFLDYFEKDDEKTIATNIFEKIKLIDYGVNTSTDYFYPPNIWSKILVIKSKLNCQVTTYGYFAESERRVISFTEVSEELNPIQLIRIKNLSKFKELTHKDYLGALMGLGLKREKMGDLIVKDNFCYLPTFQEIGDIIINELKTVGKNPVEVEFSSESNIEYKFEEYEILIASNRLDALISSITKLSREDSVKIIEKGEVSVNYLEIKEKSFEIKDESRISIKGFGKFTFVGIVGKTKKDKMKVLVKKFIWIWNKKLTHKLK